MEFVHGKPKLIFNIQAAEDLLVQLVEVCDRSSRSVMLKP